MSEFQIEVVKLGPINNHENADSLEITDVHGGYPCIIKKGSFKEGDLAVYIPVDSMVPVTNPLFAFLEKNAKADGYARIKALRLRGTFSMGLLVPAPEGAKVGDNLQQALQIKKYIPPTEIDEQEDSYVAKKEYPWYRKIANRYLPKWLVKLIWPRNKKVSFGISDYDIDGLRKYKSLLLDGTEVVINEKCHGQSGRWAYYKSSPFSKGKFYIGSHHSWGRGLDSNWGIVATKYSLEKIMKQNPNMILYGEVYGRKIQDLTYGLKDIDLLVFDIQDIKTKQYLPYDELVKFCQKYNLPIVPELYRGPWKPELVSLAEGNTIINNAGHVREGIVIKTIQGRTILKLHGEGYLTRKEKKD